MVCSPSIPNWLSLQDNGNGTAALSGTPRNEDLGSYTIVINVSDQNGGSNSQEFQLTVNNVNDQPQIVSTPTEEAQVGQTYRYDIEILDEDFGDSWDINIENLPTWLTLSNNEDGTAILTGVPSAANSGTYNILITITDEAGAVTTQEFSIEVNSLPVLVDRNFNLLEDQQFDFEGEEFTTSFSDDDGDEIEFVIIKSIPFNGSLVLLNEMVSIDQQIPLASLGFLIYRPDPDYSGEDQFSWNAYDGKGMAKDNATFTFNINEINDRPVINNLEADPITYLIKQDIEKPISESLEIVDVDDENIQRARIFIQRNFMSEEDVLTFTPVGQITGEYNEEAGILNLVGEDSKENYETAIRSVSYINENVENPSFAVRTLSIAVDDGVEESTLAKRDIEILDELEPLDIPTGFTPNQDGKNDTWEIGNIEQYPDCEVRVIDRWGQQVYQSQGYEQEWDGTSSGAVLPGGTYYYIIKLNVFGDVAKGTVTLIR